MKELIYAIEYYFELDWTESLPVVHPTVESIQCMMHVAGGKPADKITFRALSLE